MLSGVMGHLSSLPSPADAHGYLHSDIAHYIKMEFFYELSVCRQFLSILLSALACTFGTKQWLVQWELPKTTTNWTALPCPL